MARVVNGRAVTGRTWMIRAGIVVAAGLAIGAGLGVFAVRTMEPGRPGAPDSLQLLLDSIATSKTPPATTPVPPTPVVTAPPVDTQHTVDSTAGIAIPNVVGLEEGEARTQLANAGFTVGTVVFKSSGKPQGTVLSTFPNTGERVPLPATVNLILSDGRGPRDSVAPVRPVQ